MECEFPDCIRPNYAKGLCSAHYGQKKRGVRLFSIDNRKKKSHTFVEVQTCAFCEVEKHWTKFIMGTDSLYNECKDCYRARILPKEEPKDDTAWNDFLDQLNNFT